MRARLFAFVAVDTIALVLLGGCLQATVNTENLRDVRVDKSFPSTAAIFVDGARDQRGNTERVGVLKNGYDVVLKDVRATDEVAPWVAESLIESLRGADAIVLESMTPGAVWLRPTVVEFFTEANPGAFLLEVVGKVVIDVEIELHNGRAFKRRFGGLVKEQYFLAPRDVHERLLHRATDRALKRIVSAVHALVTTDGEGGR
jgi:hypothetical protein